MDCPTCGARNDDRYRFCGTCGQKLQDRSSIPERRDPIDREPPPETGPGYAPYRVNEPIEQPPPPETGPAYDPYRDPTTDPPKIPNYLVPAILVTLFCCVPFGIVSIVYAAQVNGKVALGDIEGALKTSRSARKWAWLSFGVGLAITVGWIIYFIVGGTALDGVVPE